MNHDDLQMWLLFIIATCALVIGVINGIQINELTEKLTHAGQIVARP